MKIAILGWGSLVWCPRELPIKGEWQRGGPVLPIEFSRASGGTRTNPPSRLTLVIDEECGTKVPTRYAESADTDIVTARKSLKSREGATSDDGIASIDLVAAAFQATRSRAIADIIARWAGDNGFDGAVWTALPPNFLSGLKKPFSWEAAFDFLNSLKGEQHEKALEYIRKAPEEVRTPFRIEFDKRYVGGSTARSQGK